MASLSPIPGPKPKDKDLDRTLVEMFNMFRADLKDVFARYSKRTSAQHKRLVLVILLVAAVLRGYMLFLPITPEEAMAFMRYSTRSIGFIVSNYVHQENHVFHSLLAKLSTSIFGVHLLTMRLPAYLAGLFVLPLFYLFIRAMFNRYIAVIALALLAGSGVLIEQSAIGRGQSVAWFCMTAALVLGRHMALTNNKVSGLLVGVACALGTWSITAMFPVAAMLYLWMAFYLGTRYKGTLNRRMATWSFSVASYIVITFILYAPILWANGLGQLFIHPSTPRSDWATFMEEYPDRVYDVWEWLVDTTAEWFAYVGIVSVIYAAYVSGKYRMFLLAMLFTAFPWILLRARVGPPTDWLYIMFFLELGLAIGTYYFLKYLHDKMLPTWGKRTRSAMAALVLLIGTAWPGMRTIEKRLPRLPEARSCAGYLSITLQAGDRVFVDHPWSDPVRFHALEKGIGQGRFEVGPEPGHMGYVVASAMPLQTIQGVLERNGSDLFAFDSWDMMKDWDRMEIFAARYRGEALKEGEQ